MNLNVKTIEVLKNFCSINPSLVVKEGNVLTTISTGKTIVARATVPDTFTKRFAMYNLSRFINSITSYEKPVLIFNDNNVVIKESEKTESTRLTYADESGIKVPPEKAINLPTIDARCKISTYALRQIQRQLGILDVSEIAITGDGTNICLEAVDSKNPSSDTFSTVIGSTDLKFRCLFKAENLKLIPGDYDVEICSKGISHFKGDGIEYWIAVETNSTYG
jgi:hypothetical protein